MPDHPVILFRKECEAGLDPDSLDALRVWRVWLKTGKGLRSTAVALAGLTLTGSPEERLAGEAVRDLGDLTEPEANELRKVLEYAQRFCANQDPNHPHASTLLHGALHGLRPRLRDRWLYIATCRALDSKARIPDQENAAAILKALEAVAPPWSLKQARLFMVSEGLEEGLQREARARLDRIKEKELLEHLRSHQPSERGSVNLTAADLAKIYGVTTQAIFNKVKQGTFPRGELVAGRRLWTLLEVWEAVKRDGKDAQLAEWCTRKSGELEDETRTSDTHREPVRQRQTGGGRWAAGQRQKMRPKERPL
ncbi:MAG: hypothetical protein D6731_18740 [Planctomycetota bacterium]|nr:MAG: hypothetical protein D6731_18740 [Planctomycetota bacterium]